MKDDPLYQSIFPILQHEEHDYLSIAGTSVLVEHRGLRFLVTAAHVLRDNGRQNPLYLSLEGETIEIGGPALMTPDIDDTELDLAIFDLRTHKTLRKGLSGYKTISLEDPKHLPSHVRHHFFVFGFPWRKAYHHKDKSLIKIKPLRYTTDEVSEDSYNKYCHSKQEHFIVRYKRKTTIKQGKVKTIAPKPHGASGGPLFRVLVDENDYAMMLILEGILIEWKSNEVVVATKKSSLSQFINNSVFGWL